MKDQNFKHNNCDKQAHKIMTPEEYNKLKIIGWHEVCKNYDGLGGIAIRYLGNK